MLFGARVARGERGRSPLHAQDVAPQWALLALALTSFRLVTDKRPLRPPALEAEFNTGSACWRDQITPCEPGPAGDPVCRAISFLNVKHHQGIYEPKCSDQSGYVQWKNLEVPKDVFFRNLFMASMHHQPSFLEHTLEFSCVNSSQIALSGAHSKSFQSVKNLNSVWNSQG